MLKKKKRKKKVIAYKYFKKLTWLYFYFAACCEIILKTFLTFSPELWAARFQGTSLNNM